MKECGNCHRVLPESQFYKNNTSPDGLFFVCKDCVKERSIKWQDENRERSSATKRKWFRRSYDLNTEFRNKCNAAGRDYYRRKKQEVSILKNTYNENNR